MTLLNRYHLWSLASVAGTAIGLLILAVIFPWFISTTKLQHMATERLSAIWGQPVVVTGASISLLPNMELHAETAQFSTHGVPLFRGEGVRLPLDLLSGIFGTSTPRILARRVIVHPSALFEFLSAPDDVSAFPPLLPQLDVDQVAWDVAENSTRGPTLSITPLPGGEDAQVSFSRGGESLILKVTRAGRSLLLTLDANAWHPSKIGGLALTKLSGQGRLADMQLELEPLKAELDAGQIRGSLRITKRQNWSITGSITLQQAPIGVLLTWAGAPLLDGKATGTLYLSGATDNLTDLATATSISGQLAITSGTIQGIDLVTPAKNLAIGDSKGGSTPFTSLDLILERHGIEEWLATLDNLQGEMFTGHGLLRIREGVLLDGVIDVNLNQTKSKAIPLLIAGTVSAALVRVASEVLPEPKPVAATELKPSTISESIPTTQSNSKPQTPTNNSPQHAGSKPEFALTATPKTVPKALPDPATSSTLSPPIVVRVLHNQQNANQTIPTPPPPITTPPTPQTQPPSASQLPSEDSPVQSSYESGDKSLQNGDNQDQNQDQAADQNTDQNLNLPNSTGGGGQ